MAGNRFITKENPSQVTCFQTRRLINCDLSAPTVGFFASALASVPVIEIAAGRHSNLLCDRCHTLAYLHDHPVHRLVLGEWISRH